MTKQEHLIHLADHIANLETLIADMEWNDPDDERIESLKRSLEQAYEDRKNGIMYHPLF
jgi:hypothetical protein